MIIVGYARESTQKTVQAQALAWQVERLERHGCHRVIVDRMSGASKKRPGYKEMVELVEAGHVSKIVTCSLTRLGRSRRMIEDLIELCLSKNVALVSLDGSIDLSTAAGRANVALQSVFAQLERELIAERIRSGYDSIRDKRQPIHAPFGYKIVDCQLQIDVDVEPVARWLRDVVIEQGLIKATQLLNDRYPGLPKAPRTPSGIKAWLRCPTIYGHLRYNSRADNERRKVSKSADSEAKKKSLGVPTFYMNNHAALFTEAERLEAEESFKKRHRSGFNADPIRFPLSGLIKCECCGNRMQVSYKANREFKPETTYYRCIYWLRRLCENKKYVPVIEIESSIIQALVERAEVIANSAVASTQINVENPKIVELRGQLAALRNLPNNPHIDTAIKGLESEIALLEVWRTEATTSITPEQIQALEACKDAGFWKQIKPENKAPIYQLLIKKITCKGREISVELWV